MRYCKVILLLVILTAFSCTRTPFNSTNRSYQKMTKNYAQVLRLLPVTDTTDSIKLPPYFVGTINFNLRKPDLVIIHHTAQNSCDQTLKTFTRSNSQVSAHYVICKDGTVHHILNDYLRAWHAGYSKWGNLNDVNSASIGIEIDNNGFEAFTDEQITALLALLSRLKKNYHIATANFIGHADIAPDRKVDPNVTFPWKKLSEQGFGLWYDEIREPVPTGFNKFQALRIIGYNVKDSVAALQAFKRHFLQDTTKGGLLDENGLGILYNLSKKYM